MNGFKYKLKQYVHDELTGFSGMIKGRAEYTSGQNQYLLVNEDSLEPKDRWVEEDRLKARDGASTPV